MKHVLAIALLLSMGTVSAVAQSAGVKAEVPFSFRAGKTTFSAGLYTITRRPAENGDVLVIRGEDGRSAFLSASPLQSLDPQKEGRLVFNHTDAGYVLAQVWVAGENIGEQFSSPTAAMRDVMANAKPEKTAVHGQ